MSGFNNIWSQRSKVALGPLELWKIYPNLVTVFSSITWIQELPFTVNNVCS